MHMQSFYRRIQERELVVGVVGLGYVGLPLSLTFSAAGFRVIGFDIDPEKPRRLNLGESYIKHISSDALKEQTRAGLLRATTDFAEIRNCDAILLCVPTPLNAHREPDMQYVRATAQAIAPHMKAGQLVSLESTTYPGTTDELLRGELETGSSLKAGIDFFLAYSPEREDPGNPSHSNRTIPKLVAGFTPACSEAAMALYGVAMEHTIRVSSPRVGEMAKLLENIFRSVNIALVNELKMLCDRMDIDVWEVIQAASTKPFGFMPFYPGPGLGGHCIPIDPFYLTWKAREFDLNTRFIELAGEINTHMPHFVVAKLAEALNSRRKSVGGSKILILGVAYKKDVDDMRESPALRIIELLHKQGATVEYHDPYVKILPKSRAYEFQMHSIALNASCLATHDAVVIVTDHSSVNYEHVVAHADIIVDTRNATRGCLNGREKIVAA